MRVDQTRVNMFARGVDDLRGGFVNNVEAYRWITPATCNTIPSALK